MTERQLADRIPGWCVLAVAVAVVGGLAYLILATAGR